MKKLKRLLALMIVLTLTITFVTGCANEGAKEHVGNTGDIRNEIDSKDRVGNDEKAGNEDEAGNEESNITDNTTNSGDKEEAPELNEEYFKGLVREYLMKAYNIEDPESYTGLEGFEHLHPEYRQKVIDIGEVDDNVQVVREKQLRLTFNDDIEVLIFTTNDDGTIASISVIWTCYTEWIGEPYNGHYHMLFHFTETEQGNNVWKIEEITDIGFDN